MNIPTMDTDTWRLLIEAVVITAALIGVGFVSFYGVIQARRRSPDLVRKQYELTVDLSDRVTTLERERERDYLERQAERQRDHAIMAKLQRRVADLESGVERLVSQIERLGAVPEWTLPPAEPIPPIQDMVDETALYRSLTALFSAEELAGLAFDIGIDPENLDGKRKDSRARSLVLQAKQRELLPELIDVARRLRPEGRF